MVSAPLQASIPAKILPESAPSQGDIQMAIFEKKHAIRFFFGKNDAVFFAFVDVCKALGYSNPTKVADDHNLTEHLTKSYVLDGAGRKRGAYFVPIEPLKGMLASSKKPEAKRFDKWLFEEVLPALFKEEELQIIDYQLDKFKFGQDFEFSYLLDAEGDVWFLAKEICDFLQLTNASQACENLLDFEKTTISIRYSGSNYKHSALIINESGLYSLAFRSRKPEAEKFRIWVTNDLLPTLRKTGKYEIKSQETETKDYTEFKNAPNQLAYEIEQRFIALESRMAKMWQAIEKMLPKPYGADGKVSYVYLLQNLDNNLYKPGKANTPPARMAELEANGSKMRLIKTIKLPSEELAFYWEGVFKVMFMRYHAGREVYKLPEFAVARFIAIADELNIYYEYLDRFKQGILPYDDDEIEISE